MRDPFSFPTWLRQRRRALDFTQSELACKANYALATIRKVESGDLIPSRQLAEALAAALLIPGEHYAAFVTFARGESSQAFNGADPEPQLAQSSHLAADPSPLRAGHRLQSASAEPDLRHHTSNLPQPVLPTHLPAQLTALLGREQEVMTAVKWLHQPQVRLLTLTGPPGTGKTRLGIEIAQRILAGDAATKVTGQPPSFRDGVCFIPLAAVSDPRLVAPSMTKALGLPEAKNLGAPTQGMDPATAQLHDFLSTKQMLLVLDNFEQVIAAAPALGDLLQAAPGLKVLVTSRALLKVYGEYEFQVPPLALPDLHQAPAPATLLTYPAVALFVQRAQAVRPTFALSPENAQAVAQLCVWLEGLPLAIEMVAAHVKWQLPQVLLGQLRQRLAITNNSRRDVSARQQTLRGAIEWSYNLLNADERRLFNSLAVFVGGCTAEAVAAVHQTETEMERALQSLAEQSLLKYEQSERGAPRYVMLELLREYAVERLTETGALHPTQQAHATYFLALAQRAEPELVGERQAFWLNCLEQEHDNLRTAIIWCAEHAVDVGLQLAAALSPFWHVRGYVNEGRMRLTQLLGQQDRIRSPAIRAHGLYAAGFLALRQGDYEQAADLLRVSLALYQQTPDPPGIAATLRCLGTVYFYQNEYDQAQALYEQALALFRTLGNQAEIANVLGNLGLIAKDQADFGRATRHVAECLAIHRALDNQQGVARALNCLSTLAYWQGDFARAVTLAEQSLVLQRQLDDKAAIAYTLENLGTATYRQGDLRAATRWLAECLTIFRSTNDKIGILLALYDLGDVAAARGNDDQALQLYRESLTLAWQIKEKRRVAFGLEGIAARLGTSWRAVQLFGAAAALRAMIGAPLPPSDGPVYTERVNTLRGYLGGPTFADAWTAGQALPLEQAVALALGEAEKCATLAI